MPHFTFDLQFTLCIAFTVNALLCVALTIISSRFNGTWFWVIGQSFLALGTIINVLPFSAQSWVPLIVGNEFYIASFFSFFYAIWFFRFNTSFPMILFILLPVQIFTLIFSFFQPYLLRALIFSFWMILGGFSTGVLISWRAKPSFKLASYLTATPFLVLGIFYLFRFFIILIVMLKVHTFDLSTSSIIYYPGMILLTTVTLFGYFMMIGIKADQNLKEKDKAIEARNIQLTDATRNKDLFFAIVAHDLKAPIEGAARYARKHLFEKMTGLEAKYVEVNILASSLEKTKDYLDKLLWWSRAQLQDWNPPKETLDLQEILNKSLSFIRPQADLKKINMMIQKPPYPTPQGDPESVIMIINNLLSNAVKFSYPEQFIKIKIVSDTYLCRIIVEDQGIGIEKSVLDRLFKIDDKISNLGTLEERGNGLGLILVRSLAQRNKGGILIESELGLGTKATLWLSLD